MIFYIYRLKNGVANMNGFMSNKDVKFKWNEFYFLVQWWGFHSSFENGIQNVV